MASVQLVAHRFEDKERSNDVKVQENLDFSALLLSPLVQDGLTKAGFVKPSPIQLQAIPLGKFGLDLIVQAKSGTGKTCIFAVIALENIILECSSVQTLVLAPTREIASQICDVILSIGSCLPSLHCHYFIGGLPLAADRVKLKKCQIAVGTPGRIKQLIECKCLNTNFIRLFVLDEADKLLDKDFQKSINWIYQKLPHDKQMLALSATYPEDLAKLLINYMRNPAFVRLNTHKPALLGIIQFYTITKFHPLSHVTFQHKFNMLSDILTRIPFSQCLIFINLQSRAQLLCDKLNKQGWASTYICGNQNQVQRLRTMAQVKSFQCRILVTTDLTARGIDCQNVDIIINVDLPDNLETYLHRIGRAGRFGSKGLAITIISEGNEKDSLFSMNASASLDIRELPKPLSANVWNSNIKEDDCHNTETNNEITKTNDSLICILNDDLFSDEKKSNEPEENLDDNDHTLTNLTYTRHIDASDAQCPISKSDESDSNFNTNHCIVEADDSYNIKNNEDCELASIFLNKDFEERIQNHAQSIFVTTLDLQEHDSSKNYHCVQRQTSTSTNISEELESHREISECLSEVSFESTNNLKLMDISDWLTENINFHQESSCINEVPVDDFSLFYRIKSHAKDIPYAKILEELDNFQIGSKCHSSKQCTECIPSEKLLQNVSCFLNQSNLQYWKCIEAATNSSNVKEDTEPESTSFQEIGPSLLCENICGATIENAIATEKALVDDYEVANPKASLLLEPKQITEERSELLHKIVYDQSLTVTEEIANDVVDVTISAADCSSDIYLLKLNESKACKEDSDQSYEVAFNSSEKQLQVTDGNCNLDSATINGSVYTFNSISLPITKLKEFDEKTYKKFFLSNSQASIDDNICNGISEKCKVSINSLTSGNELDHSYSSQYSESEETISNEENSLDDAENFDEYTPQDNYTEETLPVQCSSFLQVFPQKYVQQVQCVCNENAREIPSSSWSVAYGKGFLYDEDKRSYEHLPFTSDCWQQSDCGYCSAQAENNYRQLLYHQNHYGRNAIYKYCEQCENKHRHINPNFFPLPPKTLGKVCYFNNFCCQYCYWQQCYSASQDWCYYYTRYMSEMLRWKKSQKCCSCRYRK